MKLRSDRKKYIIIGLCAILLVMSVGYAAFRSLLRINGTATLTSSFCIGFDNTKTNTYVPTPGMTGSTVPSGTMTYSGAACSTNYQPSATLSSNFKLPGDKIEYTLTITNKSTFAVAIKSILVENQSVTSNTTITKGNVNYIVEMPLSTTLSADAGTTMKVTAEFQNDTNITGNYTGEHQTLDVKINAEQDNGGGGFTPTPSTFTGSIYRWSTATAYIGEPIVAGFGTVYVLTDGTYEAGSFLTEEACIVQRNTYLGQGMPESYTCQQKTETFDGIGEYTTDASTLNKTYYLKHDVEDDIITASYVCFVYNNTEHCMKGSDGGASFAANTQMIQDYQTFYNLGAYSNGTGCLFSSSESSCSGGFFGNVSAHSIGGARVRASSDEASTEACSVVNDSSYCGG